MTLSVVPGRVEYEHREDGKQVSGCWAGAVTADEYGVSFWGDGNVLELHSGDECTAL